MNVFPFTRRFSLPGIPIRVVQPMQQTIKTDGVCDSVAQLFPEEPTVFNIVGKSPIESLRHIFDTQGKNVTEEQVKNTLLYLKRQTEEFRSMNLWQHDEFSFWDFRFEDDELKWMYSGGNDDIEAVWTSNDSVHFSVSNEDGYISEILLIFKDDRGDVRFTWKPHADSIVDYDAEEITEFKEGKLDIAIDWKSISLTDKIPRKLKTVIMPVSSA